MAHEPDERRRRLVQLLGAGAVLGTATATAAGDEHTGDDDRDPDRDRVPDPGLRTIESDADFETTVDRVEPALEARDLMLVTTVDHAENAASIGEELPPTTLFVFGNPEAGTPLIQASRSIAIDLPQKLLVWEADGDVFVTYNNIAFLADRHDLEGVDEQLAGISEALDELALAVARGEDE